MSKDKIINFYEQKDVQKLMPKNTIENYEKHHIKSCSRVGVIASSGGGKTNFLLNFIAITSGSFGHIHVVYQMKEPLYDYLETKVGAKNITFYENLKGLPLVNEFPKSTAHLLIFDDCVNCTNLQNEKIKEFFIRGRKQNIFLLYLSQSFFGIPKLIRLQMTYLILLKLSSMRDLNLIMRDFSIGVSKELLFKTYKDATSEPMNFLKIDLNTNKNNEKFSKNWNEFYNLKSTMDDDKSDSESEEEDVKPLGRKSKK